MKQVICAAIIYTVFFICSYLWVTADIETGAFEKSFAIFIYVSLGGCLVGMVSNMDFKNK